MNNFLLSSEDIKVWNNYIESLQNENNYPKYIFDNNTLSRKLDLHGHPIHAAWHLFNEFIENHSSSCTKSVIVITGKSGQMSIEFKEWCKLNKFVKKYEPVNTTNGNPGSYRVFLA